jgi:hypothetical protein
MTFTAKWEDFSPATCSTSVSQLRKKLTLEFLNHFALAGSLRVSRLPWCWNCLLHLTTVVCHVLPRNVCQADIFWLEQSAPGVLAKLPKCPASSGPLSWNWTNLAARGVTASPRLVQDSKHI